MSPIEVEAAKIELNNKIQAKLASIDSIEEILPYADGQAYYNDKRRISTLHQEIAVLNKELLTYESGTQIEIELKEGNENHE